MAISAKKKIIALFVGLIAFIVILAGAGFLVYRVYWKVDDSGLTRTFAKVFSLPAARVGSRTVTYDSFLGTRGAVKRFIASDAGKQAGVNMPPEQELNKNILERLIRIAIIQEMADAKKITVSDDDVKAVFADVIKAAASSTTPNVGDYLNKNYGWNEEEFRQQVLRPALLEQKLGVEMSKEKQGDANAMDNEITARRDKADVVMYLKF